MKEEGNKNDIRGGVKRERGKGIESEMQVETRQGDRDSVAGKVIQIKYRLQQPLNGAGVRKTSHLTVQIAKSQ